MKRSISITANLALATLALMLELLLFLLAPVATFFIVFADAERLAQLLALVNLRARKLVHLMRLEPLCVGTATFLLLL